MHSASPTPSSEHAGTSVPLATLSFTDSPKSQPGGMISQLVSGGTGVPRNTTSHGPWHESVWLITRNATWKSRMVLQRPWPLELEKAVRMCPGIARTRELGMHSPSRRQAGQSLFLKWPFPWTNPGVHEPIEPFRRPPQHEASGLSSWVSTCGIVSIPPGAHDLSCVLSPSTTCAVLALTAVVFCWGTCVRTRPSLSPKVRA